MDIKVNPSEYVWTVVNVSENVQLLGVTDPTNGHTIISLVMPFMFTKAQDITPELKKFILNTYICGFMHGHRSGTTEKIAQIRNALGL